MVPVVSTRSRLVWVVMWLASLASDAWDILAG